MGIEEVITFPGMGSTRVFNCGDNMCPDLRETSEGGVACGRVGTFRRSSAFYNTSTVSLCSGELMKLVSLCTME